MKIHLLFIILFCLFCQSCGYKDSYFASEKLGDPTIENQHKLSNSNIRFTHDYFSKLFCENIIAWKNQNYSKADIVDLVFNEILVNETLKVLEIGYEELIGFYELLEVSSHNYHLFGFKRRGEIADEYREFFNELEALYYENENHDIFFEEVEQRKIRWFENLEKDIVNSVIEVLQSSLPYWEKNYNCWLLQSELEIRGGCGGSAFAFADAWGGLVGGFAGFFAGGVGSVPGAMIGAETGTLGAAISLAIFGTEDCDE